MTNYEKDWADKHMFNYLRALGEDILGKHLEHYL